MKSIFVTGGAGFIGSHLVDNLILEYPEHNIIVIDNLSNGREDVVNKHAKFIQKDLTLDALENLFEEYHPEFIFHFAAQVNVRSSIENPQNDVIQNIQASISLLELSVKYNVKKFIFASSGGAIYDEHALPADEKSLEMPVSPYGINKLTIDYYLHYYFTRYNLDYTSLRFSNVYGPRQNPKGEAGVISVFITQILEDKPITKFGDGSQTRDFVYVKDVVLAAIKSSQSNYCGTVNIGTGVETSINTVMQAIEQHTQKTFVVNQDDDDARRGVMRSVLNVEKAHNVLQWKPTFDFESGIKETVEWFKNSR